MQHPGHHLTRRSALRNLGGGMGALAFANLFPANTRCNRQTAFPTQGKAHHPAVHAGRAPSAVDTFDYKPAIEKHAGQRPEAVQFRTLRNTKGGLLKSPFEFKQYGQSGKWVSDIFKETAKVVDDICFIDSMYTDLPEHASGIYMMNIGHNQAIRPSLGAWMSYGLGSDAETFRVTSSSPPAKAPRGEQSVWSRSSFPANTLVA